MGHRRAQVTRSSQQATTNMQKGIRKGPKISEGGVICGSRIGDITGKLLSNGMLPH
jgi:hypothetical protein